MANVFNVRNITTSMIIKYVAKLLLSVRNSIEVLVFVNNAILATRFITVNVCLKMWLILWIRAVKSL